ncbi:MAG TPA: hypothetical protein VJM06_02430 [Gaiellaceae bacterium]|nr:hypothetical protein [Gaiellaceae bacterium]
MDDEFRVEVELDDEAHGHSLREGLRALALDDDARKRLGKDVAVTRDGSRLFLYADDEGTAQEAAWIVRTLADADDVTAEIRVTRWHPIEESWKDASLPLPVTEEERQAEYSAREVAEADEVVREGSFDWTVAVRLSSRDRAQGLVASLSAEGVPVVRRWRYLVAGALTEERAEELAERIRAELEDDEEARIETDLSDVERSPLQFLPF